MTVLLATSAEQAAEIQPGLRGNTLVVQGLPALQRILIEDPSQDLVVMGPDVDVDLACEFAAAQRMARPTLGVILLRRRVDALVLTQSLRAGMREVVRADDLVTLGEACERSQQVSAALRPSAAGTIATTGPRGRVITVFSAKGGCGKTTISTNLATALAVRGKRVCLVDLDLAGGDVAIALQLFPQRTIADATSLAGSFDEVALKGLVTEHSSGLHVLAAPTDPGSAERIPATLVAGLLQALRAVYDVVVVDTPPAFTDHVLTAFDEADEYLLLATLDVPALKNLKVTLETLTLLDYPRDRWRLLLNRSDARVGLSKADAERALGAPVVFEIPSSGQVPAAINRGVPIVLDSPKHAVSIAFGVLADSLLGTEPAPARHVRGLLRVRRSVVA